jgi:hypothetical protein
MGALANAAKKVVTWVGNVIDGVVSWWKPHKEAVNRNTFNFIMGNQLFISQSQDKKTVIEIMGVKDEKRQLEDISASTYKNLSWADRQRIDGLLEQRNY